MTPGHYHKIHQNIEKKKQKVFDKVSSNYDFKYNIQNKHFCYLKPTIGRTNFLARLSVHDQVTVSSDIRFVVDPVFDHLSDKH